MSQVIRSLPVTISSEKAVTIHKNIIILLCTIISSSLCREGPVKMEFMHA